jgi:Leucine-rich repeat (LRR) protein
VDLSRNHINTVDQGHMQNMAELEFLNLGFNRITSVQSIGLCGAPALRWLVLKRNSLRSTAGLETLLSLVGTDG